MYRWWWYFIWAFLQPILCGWIAVAPPVVGNWCAGGFTMINQFKDGHGTLLSPSLSQTHATPALLINSLTCVLLHGPVACDTMLASMQQLSLDCLVRPTHQKLLAH